MAKLSNIDEKESDEKIPLPKRDENESDEKVDENESDEKMPGLACTINFYAGRHSQFTMQKQKKISGLYER